ncbi:DUF4097 family beta strand repeat-containing protein [Luedemannella helvata]|uniref:DUF4097 family beta strand repeat-containing protein n=1 Tax=Luedemannella helvata TaxID=349315 RepID=A0ABP4VPZ3_9ACTN
MTTRTIHEPQRLPLDGDVSRLDVWLAAGRLNVVGTDGPPSVTVKLVGRKGLTVSHENGELSVRHEIAPSRLRPIVGWWLFGGKRRYNADVTIAVPTTAAASLTLISGSLTASGLRDGVDADVISGSITLLGLGGRVRAKTVSGSVEALGVGGDLLMETVSGEIVLGDSSADRVKARTISGSVTCDLDNPKARDIRVDTTSGEIVVRVPENADLQVDLNATSGRVSSAFPQIASQGLPGARYARGRLGAGTGQLSAYAVSGNVSLLARPTEDFSEEDQA